MRNIGRDEQKITRLIDRGMFEVWAILRFGTTLNDVNRRLVSVVIMRCGLSARRDDDEMHAQMTGASRTRRNALEVRQALFGKVCALGMHRNHRFILERHNRFPALGSADGMPRTVRSLQIVGPRLFLGVIFFITLSFGNGDDFSTKIYRLQTKNMARYSYIIMASDVMRRNPT